MLWPSVFLQNGGSLHLSGTWIAVMFWVGDGHMEWQIASVRLVGSVSPMVAMVAQEALDFE